MAHGGVLGGVLCSAPLRRADSSHYIGERTATARAVWLIQNLFLRSVTPPTASRSVRTADARLLHARARLARAQRAKLLVEHGDFPQEARFVNALRGPLNSEATPTQRASGRLARATSALRALLEHKARIAEETRRQDAEEEARACARRLQRANAMVYGVGRCWVAWCHFLYKNACTCMKKGFFLFGSRRIGAREEGFLAGGGARKNAIFGPTAPFSITPPARSGPWTLRWMWTLGEFARPRERVCVVVGL